MWGGHGATHEMPSECLTGGGHRNVLSLHTAVSGSSGGSSTSSPSPQRHQVASNAAGSSSRMATAYRSFKQWVEALLVTELNPTVKHISASGAVPATATAVAGAAAASATGSPTSSTKNKREGNNPICSDFSRSCCSSATPFSRDVSPDVWGPLRRPQVSSSSGGPPERALLPALGSLSENIFSHRPAQSQTGLAYLPSRLPASGVRTHEERPSQAFSGLCGKHFASKDSCKEQELLGVDIHPGVCPRSSVCTPSDQALPDASHFTLGVDASAAPNSQPTEGRHLSRRASLRGPCLWGPQPASAGGRRTPLRKSTFIPFGSSRVRWEDVEAESSSGCPLGARCEGPPVPDEAGVDGAESCWRTKGGRWPQQGQVADAGGTLGTIACMRVAAGGDGAGAAACKAASVDVPCSSTRSPRGLPSVERLLWRMKGTFSSTLRSRTSGADSRLHSTNAHRTNSAAVSGVPRSGICKEEGFVHGLNSVMSVRFSNANSRSSTNAHPHADIYTNSTNNSNSNSNSSHVTNTPHHHFSLIFRDAEVETAYGEFLRKARAKRLVVVGILTIVLNTLYDLPEWTAMFTSPLMEQSPSGTPEAITDASSLPAPTGAPAAAAASPQHQYPGSLSTGFLLALDVIEVLLQVVLASAGYLPLLKRHTERAAVSLMLSAFFLSSIRPATLLLKTNQTISLALTPYKEALLLSIQAIMTSTFLRSIVGSVLIDAVCLVRRRKLMHYHKLTLLLLLLLLTACTVGGVQMGFPFSFLVFPWTVGLASGIVIGASYAGAYMAELMHRRAFLSVAAVSAKLQILQEESTSQKATGKNMLEQLVGLVKQMGVSLSAVDPTPLDKTAKETFLYACAVQAKCLDVLTSGRNMYAVNWLAPEVPPDVQQLYRQFIEPYIRQDSTAIHTLDNQPVLSAPTTPHNISSQIKPLTHAASTWTPPAAASITATATAIAAPTVPQTTATPSRPSTQASQAKSQPPGCPASASPSPAPSAAAVAPAAEPSGVPVAVAATAFRPLSVPLREGICLPEVDPEVITPPIHLRETNTNSSLKAPAGETTAPLAPERGVQASQMAVPALVACAVGGEAAADTSANGDSPDKQNNPELIRDVGGSSPQLERAAPHFAATGKATAAAEAKAATDARAQVPPRPPGEGVPWEWAFAGSDWVVDMALQHPMLGGAAVAIGSEWTVDMFAIDQATNGNCMLFVGLQLLLPHLQHAGLCCSLAAICGFLKALQAQYLPNLYHNRMHAALVAHFSVLLARSSNLYATLSCRLGTPAELLLASAPSLQTVAAGGSSAPHAHHNGALPPSGLPSSKTCNDSQSQEETLLLPSCSLGTQTEAHATGGHRRAVIEDEIVICIAALGHDVAHPGLNNAFLVSTNQSLALVYNDNAVLENFHAYKTFKTLSDTADIDGGILKGLSVSGYRQLRRQVIELILSTDMAQHFPILSSFRARNASQTFSVASNEDDKWMLAKLFIKAGDIGHSTLAWEQHYIWACRVNEEFYTQGDVEEQLGLVISPLCDRRKAAEMPAAQCGFLEYIVLPLVVEIRSCLEQQLSQQQQQQALCSASSLVEPTCTGLSLMDGIIGHANYNLRCWKSLANTPSPSPATTPTDSSSEPLRAATERGSSLTGTGRHAAGAGTVVQQTQ